jgi:hypothetical protein
MPKAMNDVIAERERQQAAEGWTPEHDDQHGCGELVHAACCYAKQAAERAWLLDHKGVEAYRQDPLPSEWPDSWAEEWWKPKNPRRDLVRAAALLIAEIDRLDRIALKTPNVEVTGAARLYRAASSD